MRLKYLALVVASVAGLAACQDSAVAPADSSADLYDMSRVTVLTAAEREARGIAAPSFRAPGGRAAVIMPEQPCYFEPCPPDEPTYYPEASVDYYTHIDTYNDGYNKRADLWAYAQAHEHIYSMTLTISYRSVGGQGPYGCNATPQEFSRDSWTVYGSPNELRGERYASYSAGMTWVWETYSTQRFTADYGYSIDGYNRTLTLPASHRVCL